MLSTQSFVLLAAFISLSATPITARAATPSADLKIENTRAYLPMKGGRATAGYAELKNEGGSDAQVSVISADGFKAAELHETFETDGKMGMRKIDHVTVKPKAQDSLVPGGKHIMLFDPTREFKEGETIELTLKVNDTTRKVAFKMVPRVPKEMKGTEHKH